MYKRQAPRLQGCACLVPKKAAISWTQFAITFAQLEQADIKNHPSRMIQIVLEAVYQDYMKETFENYQTRLEDLQQFAIFSKQFTSLEEFLSQMALLTNMENEQQRNQTDDEDRLRLSTIHQAKGLEFKVVFIIMLCEGLFPSNRSVESPEGVEEERRLMYVAATRARDELYLTYPLMRLSYDRSQPSWCERSRFIREIPGNLLNEWNLRKLY